MLDKQIVVYKIACLQNSRLAGDASRAAGLGRVKESKDVGKLMSKKTAKISRTKGAYRRVGDHQMDPASLCAVEKRGRVHVITLTGAGEHCLGPALLSSVRSAVAAVRATPGAGALVIAAEGKYFSNGFDQAWARTAPPHLHASMEGGFRSLVADLLALPMPTVAAVTGHAAAAGCALALAHDTVVMRASRGFLYMSEVDAGIKIVDFFGELIRQKVPDAVTRRDMLLRGDKMTAAVAVRRGIVDAAVDGGADDVVAAAVQEAAALAARGWKGEVVAEIRKEMWPALWSKVKDHGGDEPARSRL